MVFYKICLYAELIVSVTKSKKIQINLFLDNLNTSWTMTQEVVNTFFLLLFVKLKVISLLFFKVKQKYIYISSISV